MESIFNNGMTAPLNADMIMGGYLDEIARQKAATEITKLIVPKEALKGMLFESFDIQRVIFSNRKTIVLWADGTKTIVTAQDGDNFNKTTGLAMCIAKKALGNTGSFNEVFKKWIPEYGNPEINLQARSPRKHRRVLRGDGYDR